MLFSPHTKPERIADFQDVLFVQRGERATVPVGCCGQQLRGLLDGNAGGPIGVSQQALLAWLNRMLTWPVSNALWPTGQDGWDHACRHHGSGHRSLGARDFSSVVFSTHPACPLCLDVLIGALSTRTKITSTRGRFIAHRFFDFITYDEGVTE
jgi:hypothetical protein